MTTERARRLYAELFLTDDDDDEQQQQQNNESSNSKSTKFSSSESSPISFTAPLDRSNPPPFLKRVFQFISQETDFLATEAAENQIYSLLREERQKKAEKKLKEEEQKEKEEEGEEVNQQLKVEDNNNNNGESGSTGGILNHPPIADRDARYKEARQLRVLQCKHLLNLLVHASRCPSKQCQYLNCRNVKKLFLHGVHCRTRASGGCVFCKNMWFMIHLHSRVCKDSECRVPRCSDVQLLRRLQQQSVSRRRAAAMERMRQRAA